MPGSWKPLTHQPTFNASTMLLLTDGTVMCSDEGASASGSPNWFKLTPDTKGDYVAGTWSALATGLNSALYFASAVLADGRVFMAGGEYNGTSDVSDLLAAQLYDPVAGSWTSIATPANWTKIGDASSCVLPDGRVLLGSIESNRTAIYDPVANGWTAANNKNNASSNEETWTLLPDGTILTEDCFGHPNAEKYVIGSDKWVSAGTLPSDLVEDASKEIGPALLLPDGRVFVAGATGHTALYNMPALPGDPGTWTDGPMFPQDASGQQLIAKDAPGCLLPNGRVLCAVGPAGGCDAAFGGYCPPTYFFEFDPADSTLTPVPNSANNGNAAFSGRMLLLPTGQVLYANGSRHIQVYTPDGGPDPCWSPTITSIPSILNVGMTFLLQGQQLNGLSQAVSYGDDAQMATNYPLARFQSHITGNVWYCRTFGHSSMGVATGSLPQSTNFVVPAGADIGPADFVVVANGIPSEATPVVISP